MELRHLRAFSAAAVHQSFTRAARDLGVTQAAVSQQVAALEKEFGAELFERVGRGVRLTDSGRRLHDHAFRILELVDEATREMGSTEQPVTGNLRIASSTVPSEWLLPELLLEFRASRPYVRESLLISDSRTAALAVESGDADVGFVGELPQSSALQAEPIVKDELVLVVGTNHPLANKGTTTLKQLRSESLIVREPGSGSRRCVERALEEQQQTPADFTIAMEVNSNDAIRAAVRRGVGVSFLSHRTGGESTGLVPVGVRGFHPRRQLYLIRDPSRAPPTPARNFLEFVEEWRLRSAKSNGSLKNRICSSNRR